MSNELYELLNESVERAAKSASFRWHGLLEAEEIEQTLWVEILESPATAHKLEGADKDLVTDLLARMADRVCIKERDEYEHFTGNYRYSVNEAKALVEEFFLRDGETLLVDFVDVEVGLDQLEDTNPNYHHAIVLRFVTGESPTDDRGKNNLKRGITKLTDYMNRNYKEREREYRDGPGTKPSIPRGYDPYEGN